MGEAPDVMRPTPQGGWQERSETGDSARWRCCTYCRYGNGFCNNIDGQFERRWPGERSAFDELRPCRAKGVRDGGIGELEAGLQQTGWEHARAAEDLL